MLAFVAAIALASCITEATEVIVVLDTNAPSDRVTTISATARSGTSDAAMPHLWFLGPDARDSIVVPSSFAIVPTTSVPLDAPIVLDLDVIVSAGRGGEPAMHFVRQARFFFTPHRTTVLRLYLPIECAALVTGCEGVPASACTLSERCAESNLTCNDRAECSDSTVTPEPLGLDDANVGEHALPDIASQPSDVAVDGSIDAPTDGGDISTPVDASPCDVATTSCDATCVDLTSDPNNCGTCGTVCTAPTATCGGGVCMCNLDAICNGVCVSLTSNRNNCGGCGNRCPSGQQCHGGMCCTGC